GAAPGEADDRFRARRAGALAQTSGRRADHALRPRADGRVGRPGDRAVRARRDHPPARTLHGSGPGATGVILSAAKDLKLRRWRSLADFAAQDDVSRFNIFLSRAETFVSTSVSAVVSTRRIVSSTSPSPLQCSRRISGSVVVSILFST